MTTHEFTSDQISETIAHAIRKRDFEVIPGLMRLLAVQDPTAAQAILDAVEVARVIAKASRP